MLAFVDTETTGLNPNIHELLDVAIVRQRPDGTLMDEWSSKVSPTNIETAEDIALQVNGYKDHPEKWSGAPAFADIVAEIVTRLDDCILVGHNVGFDLDFLQAAVTRAGNTARLPYHKIDTVTLAWEHLVPQGLTSLSLDTIREFWGWSKDGAHSALVDAQDARRVYNCLVGRFQVKASSSFDWKRGDADAQ
jgi:DNA polymerase III epsilon subunit-like protein